MILGRSVLSPSSWQQHVVDFLRRAGFAQLLRARLPAYFDLLFHPCFDQVWVVQKVVVARRITMLYGYHQVAWEYLVRFVDVLGSPQTAGILTVLRSSDQQFVDHAIPPGPTQASLMFYYANRLKHGKAVPLHEALHARLAFTATKDGDRILTNLIDYQKPISKILLEVAHRFLTSRNLVEVLHLAGIGWHRDVTDLPSWVFN